MGYRTIRLSGCQVVGLRILRSKVIRTAIGTGVVRGRWVCIFLLVLFCSSGLTSVLLHRSEKA